jgi:16S rRNA G966 N2-methylase RsmD
MNCCDVNGLNGIFRGRHVEQEKNSFLKHGLNKRQQGFLEQLKLAGLSVLDIGCGSGALAFEALKQGASQAQLVEVSRAYLRAARDIAERLELQEKSRFYQGDFVKLELAPADLVMLDRVVCCYPSAETLLKKAAAHSRRYLVFTQPRALWFIRLGRVLLNTSMRLLRNPYRFYLHEAATLTAAASASGHELHSKQVFGFWELCVFELVELAKGS